MTVLTILFNIKNLETVPHIIILSILLLEDTDTFQSTTVGHSNSFDKELDGWCRCYQRFFYY